MSASHEMVGLVVLGQWSFSVVSPHCSFLADFSDVSYHIQDDFLLILYFFPNQKSTCNSTFILLHNYKGHYR